MNLARLKFFFLFFLVVTLLTGGSVLHIRQWSQEAGRDLQSAIVEFPAGTNLKTLAAKLENAGVVDDAKRFQIYVRLFSSYRTFQAGKYRFAGSIKPQEIVAKMTSGDVYWPVVLEFNIPEGFTLAKICDRLAARGIGHIKELRRLVRDETFVKSLGVPGKSLEGFLYPATYSFVTQPSAPEVLRHMVETFWKKLPANYEKDVKKLGLSLYDAVTFASLIELETNLDDERPKVAEVIWNRLGKDDFLAIDAAIIYGIPDYDGDIKWKHLRDKKNPYNTRLHRGLPPTPIGSPSVNSLKAVLNPTNEGHYYYVVLVGEERHHFSKTLKEHNGYVRKLVQASKRGRKKAKPKQAEQNEN